MYYISVASVAFYNATCPHKLSDHLPAFIVCSLIPHKGESGQKNEQLRRPFIEPDGGDQNVLYQCCHMPTHAITKPFRSHCLLSVTTQENQDKNPYSYGGLSQNWTEIRNTKPVLSVSPSMMPHNVRPSSRSHYLFSVTTLENQDKKPNSYGGLSQNLMEGIFYISDATV